MKYCFILLLVAILSGCSINKKNQGEKDTERLLEVAKLVEKRGLEEKTFVFNDREDIENYFGLTLSDYREIHSNLVKNLVFEGELISKEDNHYKFTVEKINAFFSNSDHISAQDIIKEFGKPTRISVYTNSRYNKDAKISMTYESNSLYYSYEIGTQQISIPISINICWNIWQNEDITDRKIEGTPSDTPEYYRYKQSILEDGIFSAAVYEK